MTDVSVMLSLLFCQLFVYKLWTIDSIGSVWDDEGWTDATTVAKQIAAISRRAGT